MLDLKSCKGICEVLGTPTNSPVSPAPHFLLHLSLVKAKQQLSPANLCANLLSRIKKPLQIQLAVPVKTSADVQANDLLILMCAWHQAPLRGCWDLFPCSFAWPWCRLVLNLNSAEPSWEEEAQETAATTRHLLASHQVSMALPSYLCLKVSQWLPKGKRASQWDLGGKPNPRHSLLSTSPAITEPFSFSFSFALTQLQNYFRLVMWISVLPLLPSFQYLPTCTTTGAPLQENFGPWEKWKPQSLIQPAQCRETVPSLAFTRCK